MEYIQSRLDKAGYFEPLFTDNAHELLFSSRNGSIRILNSLIKMYLVTAANEKLKSIDEEIVFTDLNELNIVA